jgi:hypothetical protein
MNMIDIAYKKCNCPLDYWEVIVVDYEEAFDGKSVIFHHCDNCGEDFAVTDFFTGEILFKYKIQNSTK